MICAHGVRVVPGGAQCPTCRDVALRAALATCRFCGLPYSVDEDGFQCPGTHRDDEL